MPRNTTRNTDSSQRSTTSDAQGYRGGRTRSSPRVSTQEATRRSESRASSRPASRRPKGTVHDQQPPSAEPERRMLHAPLTDFLVAPPHTHLTWEEYLDQKRRLSWTYGAALEVELGSKRWMQVNVTTPTGIKGHLLMPSRFYGLWRRLQWGIVFFEKIWGLWETESRKAPTRPLTGRRKKALVRGRRAAAMRVMSYLRFRRVIVKELLILDYDVWSEGLDDPNDDFPHFIEFGIREYRSWMFNSFEEAKDEQERAEKEEFLALDPTAPENIAGFAADGNCPLLNDPPPGDKWLAEPWPLPEGLSQEEFMERLIVSTVEVPPEPMRIDDEEGAQYMEPLFLIWEFQNPRLYPTSTHYLDFWRVNGDSAHSHRDDYITALVEEHLRQDGSINWFSEWCTISPRSQFNPEEEEMVYVNRAVTELEAGRMSLDQFIEKLFDGEGTEVDRRALTPWNTDEEMHDSPPSPQRSDSGSDQFARQIWERVEAVLVRLRDPGIDMEVQEAQDELAKILGPDSSDTISKLIDNSIPDPDGDFAPGATAAVKASMDEWLNSLANRDAEWVPDEEEMAVDLDAGPRPRDVESDMELSDNDSSVAVVHPALPTDQDAHVDPMNTEPTKEDEYPEGSQWIHPGPTQLIVGGTKVPGMRFGRAEADAGIADEAQGGAPVPQTGESRLQSSPPPSSDFDIEHLLQRTSPVSSISAEGNQRKSPMAENQGNVKNKLLMKPLTDEQKYAWRSHWAALIPITISASEDIELELDRFVNWAEAGAKLCGNYAAAAELGSSVFGDTNNISANDRAVFFKRLCTVLEHFERNGMKIPISAGTTLLNDVKIVEVLHCAGDVLRLLLESWESS